MNQVNKAYSTAAVLILVLIIYWSFATIMPSANTKDSEDSTEFSLHNALAHVKVISAAAHRGGTDEHKVVRDYLVSELKKLGLEPQVQFQPVLVTGRGRAVGTTVENVMATVKGRNSANALLLLSHYDSGLPYSLGASDDASGVATTLEGLRAFLAKNETPENDIIILFTDAEEIGLLGAKAFLKYHPWAADVKLAVNFEARGSGGPSIMLMETNGKNGRLLSEYFKANPKHPFGNSLLYSIYKVLPNDTDLTPFRELNNINGFNFAFIDDHFDYHTAQDTYERLDKNTLAHQGEYVMSMLSHFSNADLGDLDSDEDSVFVNFPIIKQLHYPIGWSTALFVLAIAIFVLLLIVAFWKKWLTLKGVGLGFIPFIGSLVVCGLVSYLLWKVLLIVHPQYQDILHGFTYNGYQYIAGFISLSIWLVFAIYSRFYEKVSGSDLVIAPVFIWLVLNGAVIKYLPGAGFLIIPVLLVLAILALTFTRLSQPKLLGSFVVFSIPMLYIMAPMIKLFPVGLGLSFLFASSVILILVYGLLIPIISSLSIRKLLSTVFLISTIGFLTLATFNSGFSPDKRKPNNIIFNYNADTNESYWTSRNHVLDEFLNQFLGENPNPGPIPSSAGIRIFGTRYHSKTENREVNQPAINIEQDTIIGSKRYVTLTIDSGKLVGRYDVFTNNPTLLSSLTVNGTDLESGSLNRARSGTLLTYYATNSEQQLTISFSVESSAEIDFDLQATSYDLLDHDLFNIQPRNENMMPMAFISGDAIMVQQKIILD